MKLFSSVLDMCWSNILSVSTACLAVYAQTNLPPLADDTQWSVSTRITIDAPINEVWDVLLDWEKYSEWNPFVR